MSEEKFSLFIPIEIEKSEATGADRYANMRFKGIASNPNLGYDRQGQWLDPSGFQLDEFLKSGTLNWHHIWKDKPTAIIGEPTVAKITKNNELYVEGTLYKDSQMARDVYDLAEVFEKSSTTRRLGFSIEGSVLLKDPKNQNRILKSKITQLAITPAPICPGTKLELMKGGLDSLKFEDTGEFLIDVTRDGIRYTVDKNLILEKAMEAGAITGRDTADKSLGQEPLKQEDVDGVKKKDFGKLLKNLRRRRGDKSDDNVLPEGEGISKGEVLAYLADEYQLDAPSCLRVYELAEQIEKAGKGKGEGSKGGKILGHTRSGKPVYDHAKHKEHDSFVGKDHADAFNLHQHYRVNSDDDGIAEHHEKQMTEHRKKTFDTSHSESRSHAEKEYKKNSGEKKKHSTDQLTAHAENTSTVRLKEVIKDEQADAGLKDAAKRELERRKPTK